jgi:AAA15 family ATPase/GTPase
MITRMEVEGFKGLKHLSIPKLTRITLVGGKNNVGKTSLLEALFLFFDRTNPQMITSQFARRGVKVLPLDPELMWAPIFHDYEMKNEIGIAVTSVKSTETMSVRFNPNFSPSLVRAKNRAQGGQQPQIRTDQEPTPSYALDISYKVDGKKATSHLVMGIDGLTLHVGSSKVKREQAVYIASRSLINPNEDAERFGKLDILGKQDEVIRFLRIIEPNLRALSSVTVGNISMIYGDIGLGRKIPVPYMGEGVSKLLSIILAIANAKAGLVLIDEFENGIHYSVMERIWEAIGKAAREFDCQVIATTHSYECVEAFYEALSGDLEDDATYLRLDRIHDEIKAKIFDIDMLKVAITTNSEVR